MNTEGKSLLLSKKTRGRIKIMPSCRIDSAEDLSVVYTPGVAALCRRIAENREEAYLYTIKSHTIAVVTDGTAVLGLGNIGPEAALPVMEGKAALFKRFGGVDAIPICLGTTDTEEIVRTIINIAPAFGGINLEDISAPRCFEIESRLQKVLPIPVFHDDQHGTAIVVAAGLLNALRVVGKLPKETSVVINGAGAAGIAIAKMLLQLEIGNIVLVDKQGALASGADWMNAAQIEIAKETNRDKETGKLAEILAGKDVFIGVSAPNVVSAEMISTMNSNAIVFAMANPVPEIMPEQALRGGARIVATGRSDYPNQINNMLVFPGIFRGALEAGATKINEEMKLAAVYAIASMVAEDQLSETNIIPSIFNESLESRVASSVSEAAHCSGVVRTNR